MRGPVSNDPGLGSTGRRRSVGSGIPGARHKKAGGSPPGESPALWRGVGLESGAIMTGTA